MKHSMKIMIPFLMIAGLLTGCGSQTSEEAASSAAETTQAAEAVTTTAVTEQKETADTDAVSEAVSETPEEQTEDTADGNILVVYYSAQEHTKGVAEIAADALGADVFVIEPVDIYTEDDLNWRDEQSRVVIEHNDENRLNTLESYGIPTEFHAYEGLPHGFGLGTGTVAEGWIYDAVNFWEEQFSDSIPTKREPANLQNRLLNKAKNAHGNDYDLNHDERWDVFDLCLMKRELLNGSIEFGTQEKDSFIVDNVLHSDTQGDIHFSSYIPESYDGSEPYALFVTLPGWEGLYFQGVGANLGESYPFEARNYNDKMIVLSTQLDDWGETSANMAIELTEYFLEHYNIDRKKVYLHGFSGGGETGSLVMGKRPELFSAYLMTSSKWDGDLEVLANAHTPVYMAIGVSNFYPAILVNLCENVEIIPAVNQVELHPFFRQENALV